MLKPLDTVPSFRATITIMQNDRQARLLSYATVSYNVLEGLVSVVFAVRAGSSALLGFGADSFIESLSGLVMIWRFSGRSSPMRERRAAQLVGWSLLIIAVFVLCESAQQLYSDEKAEPSPVGIAIAIVSLVVMPILFVLKRRVALAVESRSLLADAKQTLACACLSVALLIGLGMNYLFDWPQADPIAALGIGAFLTREGYLVLREGHACGC